MSKHGMGITSKPKQDGIYRQVRVDGFPLGGGKNRESHRHGRTIYINGKQMPVYGYRMEQPLP